MPVKGSSSLPALNLQVVEHLFFISEGQASRPTSIILLLLILNLLLLVKNESYQLSSIILKL